MDVNQEAEIARRFREKTGEGIRDCVKALRETDFDEEKALEWLKEHAGAKRMITYR